MTKLHQISRTASLLVLKKYMLPNFFAKIQSKKHFLHLHRRIWINLLYGTHLYRRNRINCYGTCQKFPREIVPWLSLVMWPQHPAP